MNSALYTGEVRHRRFAPAGNSFSYSVALFYVDLAEAPSLFRLPGVLGYDAPALFAFRRRDYFGDPKRPLDDCVREKIEHETGRRPEGPIRLLTQISYLGYGFNPVSFYYCFDAAGRRVEFILAEITNTPWNERHASCPWTRDTAGSSRPRAIDWWSIWTILKVGVPTDRPGSRPAPSAGYSTRRSGCAVLPGRPPTWLWRSCSTRS
jgi:hypothetical protein